MNPFITQQFVNAVHDQRVASGASIRSLFLQVATQALQDPRVQQQLREYQDSREEQSRWRKVKDEEVRGGRDIQFADGEFNVKVLNGYSYDGDCFTTDVIVEYPEERGNLHMHVVFDETGRVITEHWKQGNKIISPPH
jgi:hypothetical protein